MAVAWVEEVTDCCSGCRLDCCLGCHSTVVASAINDLRSVDAGFADAAGSGNRSKIDAANCRRRCCLPYRSADYRNCYSDHSGSR